MRSWQSWWIGSDTCHADAAAGASNIPTPAMRAIGPVPPAARPLLTPPRPLPVASLDLRLLLAPVKRTEHALDDDVGTAVANGQLRRFPVADVVLDRVLDTLGERGVAAEQVDLLVPAVRGRREVGRPDVDPGAVAHDRLAMDHARVQHDAQVLGAARTAQQLRAGPEIQVADDVGARRRQHRHLDAALDRVDQRRRARL